MFFCSGDFTFVRPTELTAVAVNYPGLQETGVEILSISANGRFSQGTDSPEFGHGLAGCSRSSRLALFLDVVSANRAEILVRGIHVGLVPAPAPGTKRNVIFRLLKIHLLFSVHRVERVAAEGTLPRVMR